MRKFNFDFVGNLKKYIIGSCSIILIGIIVFAIFAIKDGEGVGMDINFKGGSRFTYTFKGNIDTDAVKKVADKTLKGSTTVSISESAVNAGSSKVVISVAGVASSNKTGKTDSDAVQEELEKVLQKNFKKNKIKFAEVNMVEASIASSFLQKAIVAVLMAAVLIVIYVGIRFRKIGGVSAAVCGLIALIHDVIIAFVVMVIFRLEIDMNFVAVVLTIFGYSINDTIVIYDRIRENRKKARNATIAETVNLSINQTLGRTIMTSITTVVAVLTIAIVAEFFGLTTLRTFAIPMTVGLISGTYSSICIAGPGWVMWRNYRAKKKAEKLQASKLKNSYANKK